MLKDRPDSFIAAIIGVAMIIYRKIALIVTNTFADLIICFPPLPSSFQKGINNTMKRGTDYPRL